MNENRTGSPEQTAENTLIETEAWMAAQSGAAQSETQDENQPDTIAQEADVLVQAQSAADQGVIDQDSFDESTVPAAQKELFEEADLLVQAQNAVDEGAEKADRHLRHRAQENREAQYNPETVIDEKIKEEQKEGVLDALKNDLVKELEE